MSKVKELNPEATIVGYEGESVDGYADSLLTMLGYKYEQVGKDHWQDREAMEKHNRFVASNNNSGINYHVHYGSKQELRDNLSEDLNILIGFTKGIVKSKEAGKEYNFDKLTKTIIDKKSPYTISKGSRSASGYGNPVKFSDFIYNDGLANNQISLLKQIYGEPDFEEDETFEDSYSYENMEHWHSDKFKFLLKILEKETGIELSVNTIKLLSPNTYYEDISSFIDDIEDSDIKSFIKNMYDEDIIEDVKDARDALFVRSIIEQVYKEERNISAESKEFDDEER